MTDLSSLKPGYKLTDVGVIPDDWEVVKMGDIGEAIIGLTYSPNDVSNYGLLVLRSSNIQDNKLAFNDNVFVNIEPAERVITRKDDLLICVRNGSRQLIGKWRKYRVRVTKCSLWLESISIKHSSLEATFLSPPPIFSSIHKFSKYILVKAFDKKLKICIVD